MLLGEVFGERVLVPGNQAQDWGLGKIFGGIDPCFLEEFKDRTRCESTPDVNP